MDGELLCMEAYGSAAFYIVVFGIIIYMAYQFFANESKENFLYHMVINLTISLFAEMIAGVVFLTLYCSASTETLYLINVINIVAYVIQYNILFLTLFYRLVHVFLDTVYELKKRNKAIFYSLFIFQILCTFPSTYIQATALRFTPFGSVMLSACYATIIALNIYIVSVFAYRLWSMAQQIDPRVLEDRALVGVATKALILTLISMISATVMVILLLLQPLFARDVWFLFLIYIGSACDALTNFMSVLWGLGTFEKQYMKLCGCWQRKCSDALSKQSKKPFAVTTQSHIDIAIEVAPTRSICV